MEHKWISALLFCCFSASYGNWEVFPQSRHPLFSSFAFLSEQNNTFLDRTDGRALANLGLTAALFGNSDSQIIATGGISVSFRPTTGFLGYATETFDARFLLGWETLLDSRSRLLIGFLHESGHTADGILDPDIVGVGLGFERLVFRFISDFPSFRVGGTLKPIFKAEPAAKFFAADEFIEWFPIDQFEKEIRPFLALELEQQGSNEYYLNMNLQLGLYFGQHLDEAHRPTVRTVLGYYRGMDTRLKYAFYKFSQIDFGYVGLVFDL